MLLPQVAIVKWTRESELASHCSDHVDDIADQYIERSSYAIEFLLSSESQE